MYGDLMKTTKRAFILFLIFCLVGTPVMATTPWTTKPPLGSTINWGHPLAKGLVGCWLMNEGSGRKVKDAALKNDGIITNALWKPTRRGVGLYFDGTGDYVLVPDNPQLDVGISDLTISTWINLSSIAANKGVVVKRDANSLNAIGYETLFLSTGEYRFQFSDGTANRLFVATTTQYENTGWRNFVVVLDRDNAVGMKIYVDNILKASDNPTAQQGSLASSINLYFGTQYVGGSPAGSLLGEMGQVTLYNRALTPSEIQQLYQEPYCFIEYKPWTMWGATVVAARRFFIVD